LIKNTTTKKCLGIFVPTPYKSYDHVQSAIWIRALQMLEPLRDLGWSVSVNNPFRRYDVAIYHRGMQIRSVYFMRFLRTIADKIYWDTCVDYFDEHQASNAHQVECARAIAQIADGVCVPTEGIALSAQRFNKNVFVMPDPIDLSHFQGLKKEPNLYSPVIGWSGVAKKAEFLRPYAKFLDGRAILISETPPDLPFKYEFRRWRYGTFPDDLLSCDVAFLPRVLDSTYTANNSSFKALVFATLGIPIIASSLPSYLELASDFEAIAFLESFTDSPECALDFLRQKSADPQNARKAYDRHLWAEHLSRWFDGG
jgi:hypothetical protein